MRRADGRYRHRRGHAAGANGQLHPKCADHRQAGAAGYDDHQGADLEADITRISPGQKAYFTIFSDPDKRYDATLRTIELAPESVMKDDSLAGTSSASGSGTSNASVYYNALLDVPNPENRLRIAMTAQVFAARRSEECSAGTNPGGA